MTCLEQELDEAKTTVEKRLQYIDDEMSVPFATLTNRQSSQKSKTQIRYTKEALLQETHTEAFDRFRKSMRGEESQDDAAATATSKAATKGRGRRGVRIEASTAHLDTQHILSMLGQYALMHIINSLHLL